VVKKILRWAIRLGLLMLVAGLAAVVGAYLWVADDLPKRDELRQVDLQVPLRVYSEDRKLISVFGEKRRIPVAIDEVPDHIKNAFIAGEDARFYEHPGIDYQGMTRAVFTLVTTGEKTIGGSTITQMLARQMFLTLEKTYARKIKEIFLALRMEREFSKDEILELFLNKILLGHRAYGVGAAADVYYGKRLDELTLAQCAMIAAMAKAPSRINPITSPERSLERRNYFLGRMLELGYITQEQYETAVQERDNAQYHGPTTEISAPYLAEMVRQEALRLLGESAYTGGYRVITTIDARGQEAAEKAVTDGLEEYDRRHGYRGPEDHVDLALPGLPSDWEAALSPFRALSGLAPGLVIEADEVLALVYLQDGQTVGLDLDSVSWARPFIDRDRFGRTPKVVSDVLKPGDIIRVRRQDDGKWRLGQLPEAEAALVALDPHDGAIRALVGGYDFSRSKFNRAIQARLQPGSSFKPFLYSAALANGYTTASLINDAPIVFDDPELERTWKPQNFSEKFFGPTRMREAMVNSRNLVSIRMLRDLGISTARNYITAFGFQPEELPANLSMALGSANVPPLSMARGYAAFANGGFLVEPYFIRRIEDSAGETVYTANPALACEDCLEETRETETAVPEARRPELRPLVIEKDAGETTVSLPERDLRPAQEPQRAAPRVITQQNAYLVRSMMMDVIKRGTGKQALELGRSDLAGKTGTTNDQRDAWFSGYNDRLVTSVWVGFDSHEPLGRYEVGGRAALPVWIDFMRVALAGVPDVPPAMPPGLAQARIDPETGLLATLDNPDAIMELFEVGHLPPMESSAEGVQADAAQEEDPYDIY